MIKPNEDDFCDCVICADSGYPCAMDCDEGYECLGCWNSKQEELDKQFDINFATGRV